MMPPHHCYCEPFAGGLQVFFAKPKNPVSCLNDINGELINFWLIIQNEPDKFIEREKKELYSRKLFYDYYDSYYNGTHFKLPEIERAFRFYVMIKAAFGATFSAGWGFGAQRNKAQSFHDEFSHIKEAAEKLKGVYIDNRDFQFVIEHYDSKDTLHFIDSPYILAPVDKYYGSSMKHIKDFTLHDHQRLFNTLNNIEGKFIQTIDDCAWIRERYFNNPKFYHVINPVPYGAAHGNRKIVNELIITNYSITAQIEENKRIAENQNLKDNNNKNNRNKTKKEVSNNNSEPIKSIFDY